jgi:hypothetical protein
MLAVGVAVPPSGQVSKWFLLDMHSGRGLAGPYEPVEYILRSTSDDGRWFCLQRKNESGEGSVFELCTKEAGVVHRWRAEKDPHPIDLKISPDGTKAAVLWANLPRGGSKPVTDTVRVTLHELPTCRELGQFEMVSSRHAQLLGWEGNFLDVTSVRWPDPQQQPDLQFYRYRIEGSVVQQEPVDPLFGSFEEQGVTFRVFGYRPDWIAYFALLPRDQELALWERWYNWMLEKFGVVRPVTTHPWAVVKVRDVRTGRFRQSLPARVMSDVRLSFDGKYLASNTVDGGIALWDIDPVPRWMKAVPAGVGAFALLMVWSWWRGRREASARTAA